MNPFLLGPRERLADWKALREHLKTLTEREQLDLVAKYWGQAPLCRFAYDAEDAKSWPTMWEMISENNWCRNSVAIGMEQTLRLAGFAPDRMKLSYIKDYDLSDMILVLIVDDLYYLNYEHATVVTAPETRRDTFVVWQFGKRAYARVAS
ncbi:MAG: hypothetical protein EOP83_13470 [Verrucomicrobiaceae bacterium]|nr:MAG: hypothetical protein EOP83_13470 [Verrucomicrobiaceae bacterium]